VIRKSGVGADRDLFSPPKSLLYPEVTMEQSPVSSEEYRRLAQEHHDYESRLSVLSEKAVLTEEEEVEERLLKKKKLHLKDRMEALRRAAH
jgi:hypothetical protein